MLLIAHKPSSFVAGRPEISSCHLREVELCLVGAGSLFQNPNGLPIGGKEMMRQCELLNEAVDCYEDYKQLCLSETQGSLADWLAGDLFLVERELCSNGTELNTKYLKHAPCLRQAQKKLQRLCMLDLQAGFEGIHKVEPSLRLPSACW